MQALQGLTFGGGRDGIGISLALLNQARNQAANQGQVSLARRASGAAAARLSADPVLSAVTSCPSFTAGVFQCGRSSAPGLSPAVKRTAATPPTGLEACAFEWRCTQAARAAPRSRQWRSTADRTSGRKCWASNIPWETQQGHVGAGRQGIGSPGSGVTTRKRHFPGVCCDVIFLRGRRPEWAHPHAAGLLHQVWVCAGCLHA